MRLLVITFLIVSGCSEKPTQEAMTLGIAGPQAAHEALKFKIMQQSIPGLTIDPLESDHFTIHFDSKPGPSKDGLFSFGHVGKTSLQGSIKNNVVYPHTGSSFEMLTVLWILEKSYSTALRVFHQIQPNLRKQLAQAGKLPVLYHPNLETAGFNFSNEARDNAFFALLTNKRPCIILVPSTTVTKVPLASNIQILAHEFGHYIFSIIFPFNEIHETFLIQGLNESFADFMSFAVTENTNILGGMLYKDDVIKIGHQRNFSLAPFTLKDHIENDNICHKTHKHCCHGTAIAAEFYKIYLDKVKNGMTHEKGIN